MDTTLFHPLRDTLHQLGERALLLTREHNELYLAQSKIWERQATSSLEGFRGLVMAQQQAALAAGRVVVDSLRIEPARATARHAEAPQAEAPRA